MRNVVRPGGGLAGAVGACGASGTRSPALSTTASCGSGVTDTIEPRPTIWSGPNCAIAGGPNCALAGGQSSYSSAAPAAAPGFANALRSERRNPVNVVTQRRLLGWQQSTLPPGPPRVAQLLWPTHPASDLPQLEAAEHGTGHFGQRARHPFRLNEHGCPAGATSSTLQTCQLLAALTRPNRLTPRTHQPLPPAGAETLAFVVVDVQLSRWRVGDGLLRKIERRERSRYVLVRRGSSGRRCRSSRRTEEIDVRLDRRSRLLRA